jgi:hypothetical protein
VPNWTSLKTGLEKKFAVTQFGEMPDFAQLKEGAVSHYPNSVD